MELEQEYSRGQKAKEILENEIYKDAFLMMREGIIKAWEDSPVRDTEGQHELKLMVKLLNDLQKNFEDVMNTGKLAKIQIDREKEGLLRKIKRFAA